MLFFIEDECILSQPKKSSEHTNNSEKSNKPLSNSKKANMITSLEVEF